MKRYLVFTGECYYPSGGWEDFHSDYDELSTAIQIAQNIDANHEYSWSHVVDTDSMKIIENKPTPAPEVCELKSECVGVYCHKCMQMWPDWRSFHDHNCSPKAPKSPSES